MAGARRLLLVLAALLALAGVAVPAATATEAGAAAGRGFASVEVAEPRAVPVGRTAADTSVPLAQPIHLLPAAARVDGATTAAPARPGVAVRAHRAAWLGTRSATAGTRAPPVRQVTR